MLNFTLNGQLEHDFHCIPGLKPEKSGPNLRTLRFNVAHEFMINKDSFRSILTGDAGTMENNLRTNLIALKSAPFIAKIAIVIYCIASLQFLCLMIGGTFFMIEPSFKPVIPLDAIIGIAALLFTYGALKLFLAFKLLKRKNWARIGVVIVSALLAALLIHGAINIAMVTQHAFLSIVKHNYGLVAEIVAASLLLLPQSRGWFASKRASA